MEKAEELDVIISNYIGLSSWSVVLELLICKIDSNQINFEVIDDLVDKQIEKNCLDALIFFLQILRYLKNISPKKIGFIIDKSLEFCFKDGESTKEGRVDYKETIFVSLTSIANTEKFKPFIDSSFQNFVNNPNLSPEALNVFAYEVAIVSGNTNLLRILQEKNIENNSEYVFILKFYPNLFDPEKYLEILKIFVATYGLSSVKAVYKSQFNQKIFFGSNKFNWCITLIANAPSSKTFDTYKKLLEAGVTTEILLESAKTKSAELNIAELSNMNSKPRNDDFYIFKNTLFTAYTSIEVEALISPSKNTFRRIRVKKTKKGKRK